MNYVMINLRQTVARKLNNKMTELAFKLFNLWFFSTVCIGLIVNVRTYLYWLIRRFYKDIHKKRIYAYTSSIIKSHVYKYEMYYFFSLIRRHSFNKLMVLILRHRQKDLLTFRLFYFVVRAWSMNWCDDKSECIEMFRQMS